MKKNNKGFSLVELIIVIAIMAILAGALAPALIKYINKSRRSTDIQNADSLRTAVQTALSNPDAVDCITTDPASYSASTLSGNKFLDEVKSVVGNAKLETKYACKGDAMSFVVSLSGNTVTVLASNGDELSPSASGSWYNN
ncbi:MAG: prepilin-type N-terminal cleavage/methylation domain-containing protein [Clostridiales bacterium]|nr:prepilin-type N-terminal cleavage/methylation domain-containing protein [Clostridiales bacterium]